MRRRGHRGARRLAEPVAVGPRRRVLHRHAADAGRKANTNDDEKRDSAAARTAVLKLVEALARTTAIRRSRWHWPMPHDGSSSGRRADTVGSGAEGPVERRAAGRAARVASAQGAEHGGRDESRARRQRCRGPPRRARHPADLPLADAAKVRHIESIIKRGSVEEQQGAFGVLGNGKSIRATGAGRRYFDQLVAGTLPAECTSIWWMPCRRAARTLFANRLRLPESRKADCWWQLFAAP